MSAFQKAEATLAKPAIAGAIAAGLSSWQFSGDSMTAFGKTLPTWAVLGGVVAAATFVGEIGGNYVAPHVPVLQNPTINKVVHTAVNPLLAGGSTLAVVKVLAPNDFSSKGLAPLGLIGAGSYVAADYVTKNFLGNMA